MNQKPKESDWKKFRSIVDDLRERYLRKRNAQLVAELSNPEKTPTEQFWDTFEKMKNEKKILRDCLDGHSRSNMFLHMMLMFKYGMISEKELDGFSEELQARVKYITTEMKNF